jgi:hypothetical protein
LIKAIAKIIEWKPKIKKALSDAKEIKKRISIIDEVLT